GLGYVPNVDGPFTVGVRSSINFEWPGQAAEAAIYPANLSASRVAAHYTAATTAPSTYVSTVLADTPLLFDQYQAPDQPMAANLGTLGPAYNGLYLADAAPGAPGPVPPLFPGFPATNMATAFDAGGGAVSLPPFNFNTNTITISGWVNATNAQLPGAGIVVCDAGTTLAGLTIDQVNGGLGLGYIWYFGEPIPFSPTAAGLEQLPNSDWAYVALVIQPTEADIYIALSNDPTTFMSVTNFYSNPPEPFDGATLIGTDAGVPAFSFHGAIDQVAIWDRSLSSGELYSQYASAVGGIPPIIFGNPPSTGTNQPILAGNTLTLQANVGGTPPLSYQWFLNSAPISLGTNGVLTESNFDVAADSGGYFVIVTNLYGSATSAVAIVRGQNATAPVIVSQPASSATIYPGGVLNLPVVAMGTGLTFQWQLDGTNIPDANGPTYSVANVTNVNAGTYVLGITNSLGFTNAGPFVISIPTLVPGSYAAVVDGDAPLSWWRLNDPSAATGALMSDVMGRNPGVYTNFGGLTLGHPSALYGQAGASSAEFTGDGSYGYVPYFSALSGSRFSLEIWAEQATVDNGVTPVSAYDSSGDGYGIEATNYYWQGLTGGDTFGQPPGSGSTPAWDPTIYPNVWTHIVIIYNPGSSATYPWSIYVNCVTDGYIWGSNPLDTGGPLIIGGYGTGNASILRNAFVGYIEEVAFYDKVLTADQIQAHCSGPPPILPPVFTLQPESQSSFVGQNVTFTAELSGAPTIAYQWEKNGVSLAGQTNSSLTISNVTYSSAKAVYSLLATNASGSVLSSNVSITVYVPPTWVNLTNDLVLHLTFDGNYNDTSGRGNNGTPVGSPTFVAGKIGGQAVEVSTDTTNAVYNYVTLGTPSDFTFSSNVDFSVSYWVQFPAGAEPGDLPFLTDATNSTGGFGMAIVPAFDTGGWAWSLYDSTGKGTGVQGPGGTINDGNWHNVVETFTRSNNCVTYLDGEAVNATSIAGIGGVDTAGPYNIGQDPTGTYAQSGTFNLDDMGVWRRALTDYEAKSIYEVGQAYGKSFNTTGLLTIALYPSPASKYDITWQTGTLMESSQVTGPWTPVPGAAAPLYQFTPASTNTFFKVGQ
ncbi:MAG: LamG-like jellyroll fold domain-containing protein, partial [Verrucomicrobiota bacterium]